LSERRRFDDDLRKARSQNRNWCILDQR
jgi:hypothetical protein